MVYKPKIILDYESDRTKKYIGDGSLKRYTEDYQNKYTDEDLKEMIENCKKYPHWAFCDVTINAIQGILNSRLIKLWLT